MRSTTLSRYGIPFFHVPYLEAMQDMEVNTDEINNFVKEYAPCFYQCCGAGAASKCIYY
jgi:hypothetical protein